MEKELRTEKKYICIANINGLKVPYDKCHPAANNNYKERKGFRYLGQGYIGSINSVKQRGTELHDFWKRVENRRKKMENEIILNIAFYESHFQMPIIAAVVVDGNFYFLQKGEEEKLRDLYIYWNIMPLVNSR